jgi:hypothetical protein
VGGIIRGALQAREHRGQQVTQPVDAADPVGHQVGTVCGGSVALADGGGRQTGWVTPSGRSSVFAGFRFPVSAGGDRGRGALVPAVRAVLPGRRGAAG